MPECDFNKVASYSMHIFGTPFPKNISGGLLQLNVITETLPWSLEFVIHRNISSMTPSNNFAKFLRILILYEGLFVIYSHNANELMANWNFLLNGGTSVEQCL